MAALIRRGTLFVPSWQQVRCRSKVNIQRPKPRHDPRRLFEEITRPVYLHQDISPVDVCAKKKSQMTSEFREENPYEEFLLRQCQRMLSENRMVAVCQAIPMSAETRKAARNTLLRQGLKLQFYSNDLMRQTVADSELVNMGPWLIGNNIYVASKEPLIEELVKTLRKIPQLILLGAKVDNYLLSREGLNQVSKLPPLDVLRGELLTIMGSGASRTRSLLGRHQQILAANLDQYIKQSNNTDL